MEVTRRIEGVEMLRMTSSGTEATMTAVRLARAATGRERLLKFAGAYHGHLDPLLAQAGSGLATQALPGEPRRAPERSCRHGCGALERPRRAARRHRRIGTVHELAAIIAEPLPANMGLVPPARGLPRAPARARRRLRGAADPRRGDLGLSRLRRRRAGAHGRARRPDDPRARFSAAAFPPPRSAAAPS